MQIEENPVSFKQASPNLTDWVKEPSVKDLKQDYEDATQDHQLHLTNVERWMDNLKITGAAKQPKRKGRSEVTPKLIRKQAEWRYASLSEPFLSTYDLFKVDPMTHQDKAAAIQNQQVLNYQFNNQIRKVKFIDDFVRTAVDEGTVITRTGWDFEEETVKEMVPVQHIEPITDPYLAQQMKAEGKLPVRTVSTMEEQEVVKVVKNQPTLDVCNYKDIVIDPTCMGDLDKAKFVIYRFQTCKADLQKDGIYHNLDQIDLTGENILNAEDADADQPTFNFDDDSRKKFYAYEYWGFKDTKGDGILYPIVATYVGDIKIRMEENPFPDKKLPFTLTQYLPVRKEVYGEPDGELLEDNQKIIGAVTRGMIDIMARSANGQMGARKDALDVTNKRKFDAGEHYEFNTTVQPQQAFYMHTFPEIPQSAEVMLTMQNAEAESLTGVKAFHSGLSSQALGSVATGIRSVLDATSKRELGILRRIADGIKEIGYKVISMNGEFLQDQEVIRITDEEFINVEREKLVGKFDLRLDISTAEADNEKAQELSFMLQTIGNNLDPGITRILLADIARLRKMPVVAKAITEYQPQPDPFAEQMKQLELEKTQAEIALMQAEAAEKMAATQEKQAKASNIESETDLNNLEFVEQESGVHQERELQKLNEQKKTTK